MNAQKRSGEVGRARQQRVIILVLLGLLATWLTGCVAQPAPGTPASATATATQTPRAAAATAAPTPTATSTSGALTLTWWTPEFLSPQAPQPGGETLAQQLAEFERANAGQVRVTVELKARYGRGGLLDLLRTAQPVAPGILPDIVALDVVELEQAVTAGLLEPLTGVLDESILNGLYPFARTAGTFEGQIMALQYMADFEHSVYRAEVIQTPPATWDELLQSDETPFLLALGAPQANATTSRFKGLQSTLLSQYLSTGAAVDPLTRAPALEEAPLLRLLTFYKTASDQGLLPPSALELRDTDAIWEIFAEGRVPLAQVSARRYLVERELLDDVSFAAAPGAADPALPIADGWALAVVTADPQRQQAALALIAWLLLPENAGPLAAAIGWLPTSPAALATWGDAAYYAFVDNQLAVASSPPNGTAYAQSATRLQTAVAAVVAEGVSPQDATTAALATAR